MKDRTCSVLLPIRFAVVLGGLALLSGCQMPARPQASLPAPVAMHTFTIDPGRTDVVGELQVIRANEQDTLSDIARRFNLGYEELTSANPTVDPWLPRAGTEVVIPTQFVLPAAPRTGIVVNLAAMRLYYFPKADPGKPQRVITHPLGIGRVEWRTPEGLTKVVDKTEAPTWIPTPSIHREYAANGTPLPPVVPPGPDNPLGSHALRLGWPRYSIHGTNKPPSIGLRGSHGCLRMYPEDIVGLYSDIEVGMPVRVVNQPVLFGWRGDTLYVQSYPVLEDDRRNQNELVKAALESAKASNSTPVVIDQALLDAMTRTPRAIAIPVTQSGLTLQGYLARTVRVGNRLPLNATWIGGRATARD
jgi:L,D-transpeptidase ErfK/SrfK